MSRTCLAPVITAFFLVSCGPTSAGLDQGDPDPGQSAADARQRLPTDEFADAPVPHQCDKMDILFVVDNSGSMQEEQVNLAANFPRFIDVLDGLENQLDYRVGVTTTGRDYSWQLETPFGAFPNAQTGGDNGALLQRCDMSLPWVSKNDPGRADTFACAAQVGDQGPGLEMPLAVIKQAFSDRVTDGTNAEFVRDDALLAIVILTDEDDCSYEESVTLGLTELTCSSQLEPVGAYKAFLDGYTGSADRWAVAVIAGPSSCSSEFGDATEAARLREFTNMAGDNGVFSSICEGDLTVALETALSTFDTACNDFPIVD